MDKQKTPRKKRACLFSIGCRTNQSENATLARMLEKAGYELAGPGEKADLGIINTCTVTLKADAECRRLIRAFVRENPQAVCAVTGCYAQVRPREAAAIEGVDLVLGNEEKMRVLEYAARGKSRAPLVVCPPAAGRKEFEHATTEQARARTRANLKIQDGCDFMCSFCLIPSARGRMRPRGFENILQEARALARAGVRELVLTGINLGTYENRGKTLADVAGAVGAEQGIERVRLSSIEMTTVEDRLLEMMNTPASRLMPYLHVPLQSGSDAILEKMHRRYTAREYLDFIQKAKDTVQDLCLGTDVMVGFPGETREDFERTRRLLEKSALAYFHVFCFSPRAGTPAAGMPGKIAPREMQERAKILRELSRAQKAAFYDRFIGRKMKVLIENPGKNETWGGFTENYINTLLEPAQVSVNQIVKVEMMRRRGEAMLARKINTERNGK